MANTQELSSADNSNDPGLVRDSNLSPVVLEAQQDSQETKVESTEVLSMRAKEIESFDPSSATEMNIPKYTNEIDLDQIVLGKLKKDVKSESVRKMSEIPFFYFIKNGQRYIYAPPEVANMAETCIITNAFLNILKIFEVKALVCTTGIQNSVKVIESELHKQNIRSLPYAAWFLSRDGVKESAKLSTKQCALIIEHFVLQASGQRYNRKHTKYRMVATNFIDNFLVKKMSSDYQKALLMSIRNILMTEIKVSSIVQSEVVNYNDNTWSGVLPKNIKETYTKAEQQAIGLIAARREAGSIEIDRTLSIGDQTNQVEDYIISGANTSAIYRDQIIENGKMRRKAISGYFPVQNPKNMKKSKWQDLVEDYKGNYNNLESLNPLQIVPAGESYTVTPLNVSMSLNDEDYKEVLGQINGQVQSNAIAAAILSIYWKEKDRFTTLSTQRR